MQGLHDVEETEHAKTTKLEQTVVGPTFAVSGTRILLPKGVAGAPVQSVAESRDKLARGGYRAGKKIGRQELSVGRGGTKTRDRKECLGETGGVSCALLSALAGFRSHPELVAWGARWLCQRRTIAGGLGNPLRVSISKSVVAVLSGADADSVDHMTDTDLPVPGLTRARGGLNRLDDGLHHVVVDHHLDADLGVEVRNVGQAEVCVPLAPGATEAPDLRHGYALGARPAQPVLQLVQPSGFDDSFDPLHEGKHPPEYVAGVFPAGEMFVADAGQILVGEIAALPNPGFKLLHHDRAAHQGSFDLLLS